MKQIIVGDGEHEPKKDEICNLCTQICKNSRVLESIVLEFESLEFEVSFPWQKPTFFETGYVKANLTSICVYLLVAGEEGCGARIQHLHAS